MARRFLTPLNVLNLSADPSTAAEGDLYYNTVIDKFKLYDGTVWREVGGSKIYVEDNAPSSPETGTAWYDNVDGSLYIYDGTYWVEVSSLLSSGLFNVVEDPTPTLGGNLDADLYGIFDLGYIDFDTAYSGAWPTGRLAWNLEEGTLDLGLNNAILSVGMEFYMPPTNNNSGVEIPNGSFVMATGALGDRITIAKAVTNGTVAPEYMIGVATHTIPIGSENGLITTNGIVRGINTLAWPVGTLLYPDPTTPGGFTSTKPDAPAIRTPIAIVLRQHENTGRIYVRMAIASGLGETDNNVKFTSTSDNDIVTYNGTSNLWVNQNLAAAIQEVDGSGSNIDADQLDGQEGTHYLDRANHTGTQTASTISDFNEAAQDTIATAISNGTQTNISITYDDTNNTFSFNATGNISSLSGTANEVEVSSSTGAITIGLPDSVQITQDLTVGGNLTVNGTTTTLNTANLDVEDNIITLNYGVTGSPTLDAGIEIERGTSDNVSLRWNETNDAWEYTNDGTIYREIGSGGGATVSETAPLNPIDGAIWYKQSTGEFYVWDGSFWVEATNNLNDENVMDIVAEMIDNGTHINVTITYDDIANALSFEGAETYNDEMAMDAINNAIAAGTHDNISITYNDVANTFSFALTNDVVIQNDLTVTGNLTINGTETIINTQTLNVEDNQITLNANVTGTPLANAGIQVERGDLSNVDIRWNETSDQWEFTNDGSIYEPFGSNAAAVSTNVALTNSWWLGV